MTKSQIRCYQIELRDKIAADEHKNSSTSIREKLLQTQVYQDCSCLLVFVSFRSEIDTHDIIRHSLAVGKKVFIPSVEPQGMEFYRIDQLEGLIISKFGVPEPPAVETEKFIPEKYTTSGSISHSNLMLLPGLAFDNAGNRIGYGAGYYDRYLFSHRKEDFYKIALAYDFQIVEEIKAEEYDIKADMIITPTRILQVK